MNGPAEGTVQLTHHDGMAKIHRQEVDGYTDAVMAIMATGATEDSKRAQVRELVEWLV